MTRQEKNSLVKHLDTVLPNYYLVGDSDKPQEIVWMASDVKAAIADFIEEERKPTAGLNYEAEYKKLLEQHRAVVEEHKHWKTMAAQYDDEVKRLRLIIKIFEFVFGRELGV